MQIRRRFEGEETNRDIDLLEAVLSQRQVARRLAICSDFIFMDDNANENVETTVDSVERTARSPGLNPIEHAFHSYNSQTCSASNKATPTDTTGGMGSNPTAED